MSIPTVRCPDCGADAAAAAGAELVVCARCHRVVFLTRGGRAPSAPLPFVDPDARDLCNRATAVASSHDGRFAPEEAIDGVPGSMWRAAGRAPAWWCADLGEVQPVLGVTLVAAMAPATGRVHHVVETCEGGEDWQVRATLEQVMTDAAVYAVGFASPVAARWVRVRTEATPSAYVGWAEIGIFG
ncbi:MAG: discoidin domain-containing protein [Kofleriaceae bacterium]|nr:discoidin domain-containing protein [Kofleriaceae bacterium]MCB9573125.1 discoidin domain-containing protein [Kofleriaceae bacterium]